MTPQEEILHGVKIDPLFFCTQLAAILDREVMQSKVIEMLIAPFDEWKANMSVVERSLKLKQPLYIAVGDAQVDPFFVLHSHTFAFFPKHSIQVN